jgi:hypothetical protein
LVGREWIFSLGLSFLESVDHRLPDANMGIEFKGNKISNKILGKKSPSTSTHGSYGKKRKDGIITRSNGEKGGETRTIKGRTRILPQIYQNSRDEETLQRLKSRTLWLQAGDKITSSTSSLKHINGAIRWMKLKLSREKLSNTLKGLNSWFPGILKLVLRRMDST